MRRQRRGERAKGRERRSLHLIPPSPLPPTVSLPLTHELLSLDPGELIAAGLAAVRIGAAVSVLPVLATIPWRARIGVAVVMGMALGGTHAGSVTDWSFAGVLSELVTGASLGIGLRVTLSALQTAGTWIDEQTSTGLTAESILPDSDENTFGTAQVLTWIGTWLILTAPPWGADLAVVQRVIDSLTAIPLGTVVTLSRLPVWTVGLLRGWSDLAVGVALPVCLVAGLIQAGLTLLGRGLGIGLGPAMSPLRAGLTCLLLVVVLPWQAERIEEGAVGGEPSAISHQQSAKKSFVCQSGFELPANTVAFASGWSPPDISGSAISRGAMSSPRRHGGTEESNGSGNAFRGSNRSDIDQYARRNRATAAAELMECRSAQHSSLFNSPCLRASVVNSVRGTTNWQMHPATSELVHELRGLR